MPKLVNAREMQQALWQLGGIDFTFDELVRLSGVSACALKFRLREGWDLERAVTTPVRRYRRVDPNKVRWIGPVWAREGRVYL